MYTLHVEKMTCGHCVAAVTRAVQEVDPAAKVEVNLAAATVQVDGAGEPMAVARAIAEAGYPVTQAGTAGAD